MFLSTNHFSPVPCTAKSTSRWSFSSAAFSASWTGIARLFAVLFCLALLVVSLKSAHALSKVSTVQESVAVVKISVYSTANIVSTSTAVEIVSLKKSPFCSGNSLVSFDADLNDRDILVTAYGTLIIAIAAANSQHQLQPLDHNQAPQLRPPRRTA